MPQHAPEFLWCIIHSNPVMQKTFGTAECHNVWPSGQSMVQARLGEPGEKLNGTAGVWTGERDGESSVQYTSKSLFSIINIFF